MPHKKFRRSNFYLPALLFILDIGAFYFILYLAVYSRQYIDFITLSYIEKSFNKDFFYFIQLWFMPVVYIFFIFYERLYMKRMPVFEEFRGLWRAISLATIILFAIVSLGKLSASVSRLLFIFMFIYGLIIFPLARFLMRRILYKFGFAKEKILIMGAGVTGRAVAEEIDNEKNFGYEILGYLDDKKPKKGIELSYPVLGKFSAAEKLIEEHKVDNVCLAFPSASTETQAKWASFLQQRVSRVFIIPDLKGVSLLNSDFYPLFEEKLFLIKIKNNLDSILNRFIKRAFDLILSSIVLIFLLPFILFFVILIRLESKGPGLFIQSRKGRAFSDFACIKFRTMHVDSDQILEDYLKSNADARKEWREYKKLRAYDPRVTKVGRFLRKTSLDELPQIINIFLGSMSFVGPRPYLAFELEKFHDEAMAILQARPGLTGLWQVSGRNELAFKTRISLDTWYILNWSLWLDLFILLKTFRVVLKQKGAF